MASKKFSRSDGRAFDQLRPMETRVGVIPRADGSALFRIGNTVAIAAVYGPRAFHPTFLRNPERGVLRCNYNMMAFSGSGERVRPGPSRRSREISLVTEKALNSVIDLSEFPNTVVDVFIELLQTDAGTRCAGITAASMALADAGFLMKEMVSAVSVGALEDNLVVDLTSEEDCELKAVDIPIAMTSRSKNITLLQLDGMISKDNFFAAVELAKKACSALHDVQAKALREKYPQGADENGK